MAYGSLIVPLWARLVVAHEGIIALLGTVVPVDIIAPLGMVASFGTVAPMAANVV